MFVGKYEEVTSVRLVSKSGARYDIRLVKGYLHKFLRNIEGREVEVKCSYGLSVSGNFTCHEYNLQTKREACVAFGLCLSEKLFAGYTLEPVKYVA